MDKNQHPCVECRYYLKPNAWQKYFDRGMGFAEKCSHPDERDPVDGTPRPCMTVRIMDCSGREGPYSPDKFRPRAAPTVEGSL